MAAQSATCVSAASFAAVYCSCRVLKRRDTGFERMSFPANNATALDAAMTLLLHFVGDWRRASEWQRSVEAI